MKNKGVIRGDDIQIMAIELALPINVLINLCDREGEREGEVMELVDRHLKTFFNIYGN